MALLTNFIDICLIIYNIESAPEKFKSNQNESENNMTEAKNANAEAGVDYSKMLPFKKLMVDVSKKTLHLPEKRGVYITPATNAHAVAWDYYGHVSHRWLGTKEGLGNKAWIAMLLNYLGLKDPAGQFFFGGIGIDAFLMGANDCAAHGGMPVICTDEIICGSDEFFKTPQAQALAGSFENALFAHGCALGQGESAPYKFLMQAMPPVNYAPSLSVHVVGIASPTNRYISGDDVKPGDVIIGVTSSGLHANGISPTIKAVMKLPDGFLTKLNGRTVGEEALIPTRSYVGLVEALAEAGISVDAHLPITGDGIGKLASDDRFHYHVSNWLAEDKIPALFRFMLETGMSKHEVAETYNNGIGWVVIVPPDEAGQVLSVGNRTPIDGEPGNYELLPIGLVEKGHAGTYFEPWDLNLAPPGQ